MTERIHLAVLTGGLLVLSIITTTIVIQYKGLIDIRFEVGPSSGQVIIDGRIQPPSLPPDQM